MTLQASGAISLADIQTEFGGANPISMSEYYSAASGIPASGAISMSQFYGKSSVIERTITGQSNLNIGTYLSGQGITEGNVIITLSGTFNSTSTSTPAVNVPSSIPAAITLTLKLLSTTKIHGKGGAGATASGGVWSGYSTTMYLDTDASLQATVGRWRRYPVAGQAGGTGLYVRKACTVIHANAQVYGGGGGGGFCAFDQWVNQSAYWRSYLGGGGGGGGAGGGAGGAKYGVSTSAANSLYRSNPAPTQSIAGTAGGTSRGLGGNSGKANVEWLFKDAWTFWGSYGQSTSTANAATGASFTGRGGHGGEFGAAGEQAYAWPNLGSYYYPANYGGAGGAAGKGVDGNANITWSGYNAAYVKGAIV